MDSIENESVVSIEYVIADKIGHILDSSQDQIMHFIVGAGQMHPVVESRLMGKKVDEEVKFQLTAAEAYGDYNASLRFELGPEFFEEGLAIHVGMMFQRETEDGSQFARVMSIVDNVITADANHPLAGQDLTWHIVVVGLRAATYQETLNGLPNTSGHPCGEKLAAACDYKDTCGQTSCSSKM